MANTAKFILNIMLSLSILTRHFSVTTLDRAPYTVKSMFSIYLPLEKKPSPSICSWWINSDLWDQAF